MVGQDAREHRRAGRATPYCSEEPSRATRRHPLPRPALPRPNSGAVRRTHHHHPVRSPRHLRNPRLRPRRLHLHRHRRSPPQPSTQPPRHRNSPPHPPQAAAPSDQRSHPDRCHPRRTSHSRTEQATAEAPHLPRGRVMNQAFIVTKEHRRFTEFANAVRKEKTIGICHGAVGVVKTNSARRCANWDALEAYINEWGPRGDHDAKHYALANRSRTVFYTPEILCRPKDLMTEIMHWQIKVGICADEHIRFLTPEAAAEKQHDVTRFVELLIIDEAERLTPTALELLRDQHDRTHRAMILIGMPGIDERFRHYPQLYSRLGFSHHYRALGREELLFVLDRHWKRLGKTLDPDDFTDAQSIAAIERITRGNFRLLERLFPQINRVLKINELDTITDDVIEAAASILVIGN